MEAVMKSNDASEKLLEFPIRGAPVSNALRSAFAPEEACTLRAIETLCTANCKELGLLWNRVTSERAISLPMRDLAAALQNADQVVTLDVRSEVDPGRRLVVEDGEVIENTL